MWTEDDEDAHYGPTDWVHHVALAAYQDRPSNPVELLQALTGGLGFQEKLPF